MIWGSYEWDMGRIAGYGCRSGTGGMWVFNHAQICPSGSTYNPRWMDMYIRRPIGLERYLCHSRAICSNAHIWASMRISETYPGPMDIYVHQSHPSVHSIPCTLEPAAPLLAYIDVSEPYNSFFNYLFKISFFYLFQKKINNILLIFVPYLSFLILPKEIAISRTYERLLNHDNRYRAMGSKLRNV